MAKDYQYMITTLPGRKQKFLTAEEERELIKAGLRGDTDARNRVIMNVYYLFSRIVMRRLRVKSAFDDAMNQVISVLCEKFDKFDLKRDVRYCTYASWWVRQAIQRFNEKNMLINVPPDYQRQYRGENKRMIKKRERRLKKYGKYAEQAIRVTSITPGEGEDRPRYQSTLVSKETEPSAQLSQKENTELIDLLLSRLNPRQQAVITRRFQKGETLEMVGKSLNLTRERVRQIQNQSIQALYDVMPRKFKAAMADHLGGSVRA